MAGASARALSMAATFPQAPRNARAPARVRVDARELRNQPLRLAQPFLIDLSVGGARPAPSCGAQSRCGFAARSLRPAADATSPPKSDFFDHASRKLCSVVARRRRPTPCGKTAARASPSPSQQRIRQNGRTTGSDRLRRIQARRARDERRHETRLRIGNLDGVGALLELSDVLAA
jgi:hypothetical protein